MLSHQPSQVTRIVLCQSHRWWVTCVLFECHTCVSISSKTANGLLTCMKTVLMWEKCMCSKCCCTRKKSALYSWKLSLWPDRMFWNEIFYQWGRTLGTRVPQGRGQEPIRNPRDSNTKGIRPIKKQSHYLTDMKSIHTPTPPSIIYPSTSSSIYPVIHCYTPV